LFVCYFHIRNPYTCFDHLCRGAYTNGCLHCAGQCAQWPVHSCSVGHVVYCLCSGSYH
jgi:hypothetical protein